MKTRRALVTLLAAIAVVGGIDAYFAVHRIPQPGWWFASSTLALSLLVFAWYYYDSEARSFARSKWLNIGVIGAAIIAIPYYVFRSREKGGRGRSFLLLLAFSALCIVSDIAGEVVGAAIG